MKQLATAAAIALSAAAGWAGWHAPTPAAAVPEPPPAVHAPRWEGSMGRVKPPARYDTPAVNWLVLCTDAGTTTSRIPTAAAGG